MMGLPTETKEEVMETYTVLKEIKPYHCSPAFYTPHPGSDLYEMGEEMGIHLITDHDNYRRDTYEPKMKGPDYEFPKDMLYKSMALAEDNGSKVQKSAPEILTEPQPANLAMLEECVEKVKVVLMSKVPGFYRIRKIAT